jgi:DNA-binding LytR/AlgR family response regulator
VRETTAAMEARLAPAGFMRISRSVIVNLTRIREHSVLLNNGTRFDMTCSLSELQAHLAEV